MFIFTFLKNLPWALTLRTFALAIILLIFGFNIQGLPGQTQRLKRGTIPGIYIEYTRAGNEAIVNSVDMEAAEKGVSIGDKVLNPETMTAGEIGTPVTLLIKSGDAPAREVTFIRKSPNYTVAAAIYTEILGLSPRARMFFVIIFLWASVLLIGLFSIVAFLFRADAWLAFFLAASITNFLTFLSSNPALHFFWSYFPTALILFLILFPNGKLNPKWSWLLVFLPLPGNIINTLGSAGFPVYSVQQNFVYQILHEFGQITFLIIVWGVVYQYRKSFTLTEQRRMNWLLFGLILISIPRRWLTYLGFSVQIIQNLNTFDQWPQTRIAGLFTELFQSMGLIASLLVLGTVVYRYRNTFTSIERQQTKWLIFSLALCVPSLIFLKAFDTYYFFFHQEYDKLDASAYIIDRIFLFGWVALVFSAVIAALRYRLDDVDSFINRAMVYSGLIAMVGMAWLLASVFIDYSLGEITANRKAFIVIPISVFLIAVTFKPARFRLQALADEYFKPEDFDVAQVFFEFTPDMRGFFTLPELSKILVKKSYEQFGVAYASIFIKNKNGRLRHIKTVLMRGKIPKLVIESQEHAKLKRGELVPGIDLAYSIIIPLVLSRGQKPDFVGALVLGPRLNGLGYSIDMKKSLLSLGQEAGKALYIARIQDQRYKSLTKKLSLKPTLQTKRTG